MILDNLKIENVHISDVKDLITISRETFYQSFFEDNTEEDMQGYLNENCNEIQLTKELNNSNSQFYFAKLNNEIIGYLKLNFGKAQTEIKDTTGLEIERIYILNKFQGKKVGQKLYEFTLKIAKEKKVSFVWLGVWEKNIKAIKFYERNGFVEFDKHIFILGNDEQIDIMMKLTL